MNKPDKIMRDYFKKMETALQNDKSEILKTMSMIYLHNENLTAQNDKIIEAGNTDVGIWKRRDDNQLEYVINEEKAKEWNYWSKTATIPEKSNRKRVLLLGESVARGYFYDPEYNPSKELNHLLNHHSEEAFEVIDLARTDLNYEMLTKLIHQSTLLEPDAVVIFAGNNWDANCFWESNCLEIVKVIENQGIEGLFQYFNRLLMNRVEKIGELIHKLYSSQGVPVILVIPEFNIHDWKDPSMSAPWLSQEDNRVWLEEMRSAKRYMENHNDMEAIRVLEKVIKMDSSLCIQSLNLLAQAYHNTNQYDKEEQCLIRAKDATIIYPKISTPRTVSVVQETLKDCANKYNNIFAVDLRAVFRKASSDHKIGREYFMDYCHLTAQGVKLAMSGVSRYIVEYFEQGAKLSMEIPTHMDSMLIDHFPQGEAHFLAAIHNAHWGQDKDIIKYHLEKSLSIYPDIEDIMLSFIEFQNRNLTVWMSKQTHNYISKISEQGQRYLTDNRGLCLDKKLMDCIQDVLGHKQDLKDYIQTMRNKAYSMKNRELNLLQNEYYVDSISQKEAQYDLSIIPDKLKRYGYFKAFQDITKFNFVMDEAKDLVLRIVYRMQVVKSDTAIMKIFINDHEVFTGTSCQEWTTFNIDVLKELLLEGMNEVKIYWSSINRSKEIELQKIKSDIEIGLIPEVLPVFGEIQKLTLKPVDK